MTHSNYITTLDKIDEKYHRSHVIIHKDYQWHFADMSDMKQLERLSKTLGFSYTLEETKNWINGGTYCKYSMSHAIKDSNMFYRLSDLPADAKSIKALSNGSIVDCYFTNDGETVTIYRPNPNYKDVYNPLEIKEHIAHCKEFGTY